MAFKPGANSRFWLDNVAGSLTELSPYIDSAGVPQPVEVLDVSAFGTTAKANIPGLTDGGVIPLKGPLDTTLYSHFAAVKAGQAAGSSTATFNFAPAGSVSGYPKISGECNISAFEVSSSVGGRAEWSASLQITGAVTNGTY